jgi:vacuolar-type H+-ATPase subunit H
VQVPFAPFEERPVEKLERVLVAEDDARTALVDARTEAAAIRSAGVEDARRIEADAAEASRLAVAAERETVLANARAEADVVTRDAAANGERMVAEARDRFENTVKRVAASLEG